MKSDFSLGSGQGTEVPEDGRDPDESAEIIADLPPPYTVGAKVELRREFTRGTLTIGLFFVFGLTVVVCLLAAIWAGANQWAAVKDLLQILLPAETGLLGSAAGFYFGTRSAGTK